MSGVILLEEICEAAPEAVSLPVERVDLWKRRWRGTAGDGTEVAVSLEKPVGNGTYLVGGGRCFQVAQHSEEVVVISLSADSAMAAKIGWYLGNRHLPIEVREKEILVAAFPTLTDSLERIGIPYQLREDVLNCRPHSEHTH